MKKEQCPICYSSLVEVKEFAPCDDCLGLDGEIDNFKDRYCNYTVYKEFTL